MKQLIFLMMLTLLVSCQKDDVQGPKISAQRLTVNIEALPGSIYDYRVFQLFVDGKETHSPILVKSGQTISVRCMASLTPLNWYFLYVKLNDIIIYTHLSNGNTIDWNYKIP